MIISSNFTESGAEQAALAWFEGLGWAVAYGRGISPGGDALASTFSRGSEGELLRDGACAPHLRTLTLAAWHSRGVE